MLINLKNEKDGPKPKEYFRILKNLSKIGKSNLYHMSEGPILDNYFHNMFNLGYEQIKTQRNQNDI